MVTHTHMCKHEGIQVSVIFCILILVFEGQQYMKATWGRCCISQELVLLAPGHGQCQSGQQERVGELCKRQELPFFAVITFSHFNK